MQVTSSLLLRGGLVDGRRADVRCDGGVITHVGLDLPGADHAVDVAGGEVIAGLHDHHIHLLALAAADLSVRCGPPYVSDATGLVAALRAAPGDGWIRGIGYHDSVAGDIDRAWLDAAVAHRPVRVQHRSGRRWVLNTRAIEALVGGEPDFERDAGGLPTGRVTGDDAFLRGIAPLPLDVAAVAARLASFGVTGVSDMTPVVDAADAELLARHCLAPGFPLRVLLSGAPALGDAGRFGLPTGPAKIVIGDHDLPAFDDLVAQFRGARSRQRCVAVHSVTAVSAAMAIAAWDVVGAMAGDRLEHGALLPAPMLAEVLRLGITVVTQPVLVAERGDEYLAEVDPSDRPDLWRCASLLDAGVGVAIGTDAPYGSEDPWRSVAAAMHRTTPSGRVLGGDERISARRALQMFQGFASHPTRSRTVAAGQPAELCVLDAPLEAVLLDPSSRHVAIVVPGVTDQPSRPGSGVPMQ